MTAQILAQVEESITKARETLALANALERLLVNRDFKQVMVEGFFKQEAIRLVHLKAAPDKQDERSQRDIISRMDAIGHLHRYFKTIETEAEQAGKSLEEDERTRDELLVESIK